MLAHEFVQSAQRTMAVEALSLHRAANIHSAESSMRRNISFDRFMLEPVARRLARRLDRLRRCEWWVLSVHLARFA